MPKLSSRLGSPGWGTGRFCRSQSLKRRHLWPPDALGGCHLPDAKEVTETSTSLNAKDSDSYSDRASVQRGRVSKIYEYTGSGLKVLDDIV